MFFIWCLWHQWGQNYRGKKLVMAVSTWTMLRNNFLLSQTNWIISALTLAARIFQFDCSVLSYIAILLAQVVHFKSVFISYVNGYAFTTCTYNWTLFYPAEPNWAWTILSFWSYVHFKLLISSPSGPWNLYFVVSSPTRWQDSSCVCVCQQELLILINESKWVGYPFR